MKTLFTFQAPPSRCGYLPDREWSLRYDVVGALTPAEYGERLRQGWRRFGYQLFRPECPSCRACRSLRVPVALFAQSRSQKRVRAKNRSDVQLRIGEPSVTAEKLALYDKFHAAQVERKNWPDHGSKDAADYADSFVENPFAVEQWCYSVGGQLVGVGYVDVVPDGLSAIYFFHDPSERDRSLGTFNVLSVIASAAARGLPYVYLGYFVAGCGSLEYKANFRPNELFDPATQGWKENRN